MTAPDLHKLAATELADAQLISAASPNVRNAALAAAAFDQAVADILQPVTPPPPSTGRWAIRGAWDNPEGGSSDLHTDWTSLQAQGFNCLFVGEDPTVLKMIADSGGYALVNAGVNFSDATIRQYLPPCLTVLRPDGKPVVKWVYVADEVNDPAAVKARTNLVHSLTPPGQSMVQTMASHFQPNVLTSLAGSADWLAADYYPCQYAGAQDLATLKSCIAACDASSKPYALVAQAFTDATSPGQTSHYRMPTPAELDVELKVIHDSKAQAYFAYCWGQAVSNQPLSLTLNGGAHPDLVARLKAENLS